MAKTKGQKAIERENARLVREKKKQIEQVNQMLIPVPKSTAKSLGLVSFDPSGVFRFANGRWVKCFRVNGCDDIAALGEIMSTLYSEVKLVKKLGPGRADCFLTFILEGQIYDEVRTRFIEDEATLKGYLNLANLSVDEVMTVISEGSCNFNYASMVRGKKDWKEECFPKVSEEFDFFKMGDLYGEGCFVMGFGRPDEDFISRFGDLGCDLYLSINLKGIDEIDRVDYNRALEQRYNRRIAEESKEYMNLSMQLVFLCDSDDARSIIEKTILAMFTSAGYVVCSTFGVQKSMAESILSLGFVDRKYMRNVSIEAVNTLLGKEALWQ